MIRRAARPRGARWLLAAQPRRRAARERRRPRRRTLAIRSLNPSIEVRSAWVLLCVNSGIERGRYWQPDRRIPFYEKDGKRRQLFPRIGSAGYGNRVREDRLVLI